MGSGPTIFQLEEAADNAAAAQFNAEQAGDAAGALAAYQQGLNIAAQQAAIYAASPPTTQAQQAVLTSIQQATAPTPVPTSLLATLPTTPTPPSTTPPAGGSTSTTTGAGASSAGTTAKDIYSYGPDPGSYCDLYPDDPVCEIFGSGPQPIGGSTIIINDGGGGGGVNITVNGLSATQVDGIIDNALGDLWDATVGAVDAVIAAAVGAIQKVLTDLGNALKAAYAILSRLAGFILNLLKQLVDQVVKGVLNVLQDIRTLLGDLYKDVLLPIVNGMLNIRKLLVDVYQRFIRPMLIVLQDIRKVLSILSLFHIKFAAKLDAAIADIEARITQPLFYLLSFVNGVANWVNLIVTAGYLLQKSVFLNSLKAYVGEALNLQLNSMNSPPDPAAIAAAQQANQVTTAAQASADLNAFVTSDSGSMPAGLTPYSQQLDTYLSQGIF